MKGIFFKKSLNRITIGVDVPDSLVLCNAVSGIKDLAKPLKTSHFTCLIICCACINVKGVNQYSVCKSDNGLLF